jgi:hypothetical protein
MGNAFVDRIRLVTMYIVARRWCLTSNICQVCSSIIAGSKFDGINDCKCRKGYVKDEARGMCIKSNSSKSSPEPSTPLPPQGTVTITILEAKHLPKMDTHTKCDPFAVITLGNSSRRCALSYLSRWLPITQCVASVPLSGAGEARRGLRLASEIPASLPTPSPLLPLGSRGACCQGNPLLLFPGEALVLGEALVDRGMGSPCALVDGKATGYRCQGNPLCWHTTKSFRRKSASACWARCVLAWGVNA